MANQKTVQKSLVVLIILFLVYPLIAQQNPDAANEVVAETINTRNGFFKTFVRTPFVLFCFVGTLLGVMFSAIFEFIYNIFCGFNCGYPNTREIWNLGWNNIFRDWYWIPGVWWHMLISFIVWSPLLGRKKKNG